MTSQAQDRLPRVRPLGTAAPAPSRVVVIATGGTIASTPSGAAGVVADRSGLELVRNVTPANAPVEVIELMSVGSYAMSIAQMSQVAQTVQDLGRRPDIAGIVVTHGTDTMAETAYLTDLTYGAAPPVVFTGAQRHAGRADTDGPGNLATAIAAAADPQLRDAGALLCFDGRLDAAREAIKLHSTSSRPFESPATGPVAEIGPAGLRLLRRPPRPTTLQGCSALEPRVRLIRLAAGDDGELVDAAADSDTRALVLEAFGLGNATPAVVTAVRRATKRGTAVVVTSQCLTGGVHPLYGASGGHDLREAGAFFAGSLSGAKARLLLMVALAAAHPSTTLEEFLIPHV